jgi:hypothetical protein
LTGCLFFDCRSSLDPTGHLFVLMPLPQKPAWQR